ncbi:SDR family NAD(P)-dependent oxidoreductase [Aeromicrobium ginsengisoli]|nr:SDR family NAD(P)-dependent oxidoreductase [Aeromicrobium ginsengisoli]
MPTTHDLTVLRNTVSLVTGGASGLGAAVVSELASHGAHVVVLDPDAAAARELVGSIQHTGGSAEAVVADVRDADRLVWAVDLASSRGTLFSVVSNAGGWGGLTSHYPDASPDDWLSVLELNLVAPMRLLQLARTAVVDGGAVVQVSSSAGIESSRYASPEYAVSKAGIVRLTSAVGGWTSPRVSCVVPGWIALPRARAELAALDPEDRLSAPPLVPVGEVTDEIVRLITDPSSGGQVVVLDGSSPARPV